MKYSREDLAWVAGLFEGEGSFNLLQARTYPIARAKLNSTDRDVVERLFRIIGFGSFFEVPPTQEHHKPQWQWQIASFEGVQAFIALVWPWLCSRRQARATEILLAMHEHFSKSRRGRLIPLLTSGSR
jgi:hypothetical protein